MLAECVQVFKSLPYLKNCDLSRRGWGGDVERKQQLVMRALSCGVRKKPFKDVPH